MTTPQTTQEEWKDVAGYEGLYRVSTQGRVYSYYSEKVLDAVLSEGYPKVGLYKNGVLSRRYVHRLVATAFVPGSGECVNHKDGNRANNAHSNIEWCSRSYNNTHSYRVLGHKPNGGPNGSRHLMAILNETQVRIIRRLVRDHGLTRVDVSRFFGVDQSTICKIMRKSWRHVS